MRILTLMMVFTVFGCSAPSPGLDRQSAIVEVNARENRFSSYPRPNMTYLSFSKAHGFQVNYLAPGGRAWLWYPGNTRGVEEEYTVRTISGQRAICWRHPTNSYNPVTKARGGEFACSPLVFSQKTIVSVLPGDPFNLAEGVVPYPLKRCAAPVEFKFQRNAYSC